MLWLILEVLVGDLACMAYCTVVYLCDLFVAKFFLSSKTSNCAIITLRKHST